MWVIISKKSKVPRVPGRFRAWLFTLRGKMLLAYLGIVALIVIILNYYPLLIARNFIITNAQQTLISDCNFIANQAAQAKADELDTTMERLVINMSLSSQYDRVLVTDRSAVVLYDNKDSGNIAGKRPMFSEIFTALGGKESFLSTYGTNNFVFSAAVPILSHNEVVGSVYLRRSSYKEATLLSSAQTQILTFTLILGTLIMGLSFFFSMLLTGQIKYLRQGVRQMEQGDYESRIPITGNDELGELAGAFNDLTGKLSVTDEKRKQFVSDASHELKTPLASIKLLVDSISDTPNMDPALLNEFLGDIQHEIDRLVRITDHLFILTRMDSDLVTPPGRLDMAREIRSALRTLQPIAAARGINLNHALDEGCFVKADEEGLSHIVYNLIDNAIKYNNDFGYVTIRLFCKEEQVVFVVKDNGVGIAPEDQEKIFSRFYRVDKARSRETGGTGLGLSIVEANIHLLGGTIELESEPGKGSKFTVTLPFAAEEVESHDI